MVPVTFPTVSPGTGISTGTNVGRRDGRDGIGASAPDNGLSGFPSSSTGTTPAASSDRRAGPGATSVTLLHQARAGDEAAWRQLFRLYTPLVCYWCRKRGVHGADVDDVVQDVFQTAAKALDTFRRTRPDDTFRGWLHGITRHKVLEFQRRRSSQPQAEGGPENERRLGVLADSHADTGAEDPTAEDDDDPKLVHDLFHTVMEMVRNEFEERTWLAFWRTVIDGQRPVDVAAELNVSPAAVRMAKCRVVRRVREQLGDCLQ
jgi:RNA polymerase sigma-70 factor, ECF subfamily